MSGRSVFVTGGAGAIGRATAERFLREGWRVGVGDLSPALAGAPDGCEAHAHDVRDEASWAEVLGRFCEPAGGALDALVNNAGVLGFGWFEEQDAGVHRRMIDVNVTGVVLGASLALPNLRRAAGSCLVNIASAASLQAAPRLATYSATKFAVRGLSEALALEWERLGVRVACLEPTLIDTPMLDSPDAGGLLFRQAVAGAPVLAAADVADAVWRAVNGDALHYPVGDAPAAHLAEIAPRLDEQRRRWRERAGA